MCLAGAALWSLILAWQIAGRWANGLRRLATTLSASVAVALGVASWVLLFWVW